MNLRKHTGTGLAFTNDKQWEYALYVVLQIPPTKTTNSEFMQSYDIMWIDTFEILVRDTLFPVIVILCK